MTNSHSYELIASVIHTGLPAPVMKVIREIGCQSSTLIGARETGTDTGKKLSDMALSQGETILLILAPADLRPLILKATCETVMREIGGHTIAVPLSIGTVEGPAG